MGRSELFAAAAVTQKSNTRRYGLQKTLQILTHLVLVIVGLSAASGATADRTFESAEHQVPLIELYTSQGCSSCPPADRWLSALGPKPGLWRRYVPVAFHVTYWNYLGWRDRFSQAEFDQRQRLRAAEADTSVYTPGVFVAGEEWRAWRRDKTLDQLTERKRVGVLTVALTGNQAAIAFDNLTQVNNPQVELAWLVANRATQVQRGENANKTLRNDFVVRKLQATSLRPSDGGWRAELSIPNNANDYQAIAIWVSDEMGYPIQATGGWLAGASAE